ncbi:hypothetical protein Q8F55_003928 [Vanrija albida]|uniref:SAP domain-containing protein n=1 Tax=Vanrija albida TaxID=181172 RepID=A0ABR3Q5B4_9TREE
MGNEDRDARVLQLLEFHHGHLLRHATLNGISCRRMTQKLEVAKVLVEPNLDHKVPPETESLVMAKGHTKKELVAKDKELNYRSENTEERLAERSSGATPSSRQGGPWMGRGPTLPTEACGSSAIRGTRVTEPQFLERANHLMASFTLAELQEAAKVHNIDSKGNSKEVLEDVDSSMEVPSRPIEESTDAFVNHLRAMTFTDLKKLGKQEGVWGSGTKASWVEALAAHEVRPLIRYGADVQRTKSDAHWHRHR